MRNRMVRSILTSVLTLCLMGMMGGAGQLMAQEAAPSVVPRTPDGRPDLQGNWSNATMTPIVRPPGVGPVLTAEQVATLEHEVLRRLLTRLVRLTQQLEQAATHVVPMHGVMPCAMAPPSLEASPSPRGHSANGAYVYSCL